jgi:hypothetical protein
LFTIGSWERKRREMDLTLSTTYEPFQHTLIGVNMERRIREQVQASSPGLSRQLNHKQK